VYFFSKYSIVTGIIDFLSSQNSNIEKPNSVNNFKKASGSTPKDFNDIGLNSVIIFNLSFFLIIFLAPTRHEYSAPFYIHFNQMYIPVKILKILV